MRVRIRVPLRHPFHPEWVATTARVAKGRCAVLSGSFAQLVKGAAAGVQAECAVFALEYPDRPFLDQHERDVLWQAFQVPVFALLLDRKGRLTAWECEAQEGLHVGGAWTGEALWVHRLLASGWELDDTPCECGRPGRRLLRVRETPGIPRRGPGREERLAPAAELQRA